MGKHVTFIHMYMYMCIYMYISICTVHLHCIYPETCSLPTVVDEVTILTGGLLISKVRLMEEDNEVI